VTSDEWQVEAGGIKMGKPHHNLEVLKELEEISRMIIGLQKSLRSSK
jgi:hypothetical protein